MTTKETKLPVEEEDAGGGAARPTTGDPPSIATWQWAVRQRVAPWLPPPVARGIQRWDVALEPHVGPEATVTLATSLLVSWLVLWLLRSLLLVVNRTGRAIDDDDSNVLASSGRRRGGEPEKFDATVLLVGPTNSGKTRLFYQLCYSESDVPTLMSLKANVGVSSTKTFEGDEDAAAAASSKAGAPSPGAAIRYMDWPGNISVLDPALTSVMAAPNLRIVLVLDSTQPATSAADTLYQLLQLLSSEQQQQQRRNGAPTVFVACHKKDLPRAKNDRRIKIQLRTELERLLTVRAAANEAATWWRAGEPVELDELQKVARLHFASTTACAPGGCAELEAFCRTGKIA